ncbi:PID-CTERM protein-sorting domain-containing protein [Hymenobacter sp. B81]|uniref:PID-CTERM protein-sorting domain-containing protein n=1 Tax=Hymenobacter sp. B81 TaxID=3344878 RepID=UPI0037DC2577
MTRFFFCLLGAALLSSAAAQAQGNPGSGGPQPGQPTAVPIDGGASLLLAGGAAYALNRLRRRK